MARIVVACLHDPGARRARMDVIAALYRQRGLRGVVDALVHGRRMRRPA